MSSTSCRLFAAGCETFESVFANRFQHGEAGVGTGPLRMLNQVLIDQRRKPVEQIDAKIAAGITNGFGGFHGASTNEYGKAPEKLLFRNIQQAVAPINGIAECLLPCRQVERSAGQQLEAALQPLQDGAGGQ